MAAKLRSQRLTRIIESANPVAKKALLIQKLLAQGVVPYVHGQLFKKLVATTQNAQNNRLIASGDYIYEINHDVGDLCLKIKNHQLVDVNVKYASKASDNQQTSAEDRATFVQLLLEARWIDPHERCMMINRTIGLGPVAYAIKQSVGGLPFKVHTDDEKLIAQRSQGNYTFDKLDVCDSALNGIDLAQLKAKKINLSSAGVYILEIENHLLESAKYLAYDQYIKLITQNIKK